MKRSRFHDSDGNLLGEVPALDLLGPKYPPVKLERASAGWGRVVAIFGE
jgi:hypothetical protein